MHRRDSNCPNRTSSRCICPYPHSFFLNIFQTDRFRSYDQQRLTPGGRPVVHGGVRPGLRGARDLLGHQAAGRGRRDHSPPLLPEQHRGPYHNRRAPPRSLPEALSRYLRGVRVLR